MYSAIDFISLKRYLAFTLSFTINTIKKSILSLTTCPKFLTKIILEGTKTHTLTYNAGYHFKASIKLSNTVYTYRYRPRFYIYYI